MKTQNELANLNNSYTVFVYLGLFIFHAARFVKNCIYQFPTISARIARLCYVCMSIFPFSASLPFHFATLSSCRNWEKHPVMGSTYVGKKSFASKNISQSYFLSDWLEPAGVCTHSYVRQHDFSFLKKRDRTFFLFLRKGRKIFYCLLGVISLSDILSDLTDRPDKL